MKIQLLALADAANVSQERKLNILGEFDTIWSPRPPPVVWSRMVFVAKLKFGATDVGKHQVSLRVLNEDMELVVQLDGEIEIPRSNPDGLEGGVPVILPIDGATFESFGTYLFELVIGDLRGEIPLHIRQLTASPPGT